MSKIKYRYRTLKTQKSMPDKITKKKLWAIENAIAQQRLEGLEPSKEVVSDVHRVARGEITIEDAIANIGKRRLKNDKIRKP
jgi:hypothetical protein